MQIKKNNRTFLKKSRNNFFDKSNNNEDNETRRFVRVLRIGLIYGTDFFVCSDAIRQVLYENLRGNPEIR